ncbi:tissue factor pathway inhibitor isoform X2 [Echinops telfairi]|uniref:Tissue factor pathway inhibitor isoform X2 n=1 Tax=Echinops telfairi TaxID=9371 RepID=A0AC55DLP7_ECHTE|nr:tissue factor pathway inhibitor isoform X2 [Echinops telfairi]
MGRTLKTAPVLWASVILLLSYFPTLLSATSEAEEEDEFTNITDIELPPFRLLNPFCALKAQDGPCKARIMRFFFNIHTQQCEEFIYGGCLGNNNSFENLEECRENCVPGHQKITTTLLKEKPEFCFLEEDVGICRGYITRYFYNKESKKCERFKYGGCLGNMNNFESLEECKSSCEDTVNDVNPSPDVKTPLDPVTNYTLTPQPTKVFKFSVTKETTNDGWRNADRTYQAILNAFCIHSSLFLLGLGSSSCIY